MGVREGRPEVLDPKEAAKYLRVSLRTLYALVGRGAIPAAKVGNQWRFHRSSLEALLRSAPSASAPQ